MGYNSKNIYNVDVNINDTNIKNRTIYYAEVISIEDETDGGRIKVKINGLDNHITNENLPWCYPLLPKFFHIYPQVGEVVRIFIENVKYPNKSRFWLGSLISQPQKIGYDSVYTAYSTTNISMVDPEPSPSSYPDSKGVFPDKKDVAIIGRVNTDIILKENEVHFRAGKHENDNIMKLNIKNPSHISLIYEKNEKDEFYSNNIIMADKIGIISHEGNPKFKSNNMNSEDRKNIFDKAHPTVRGDILVEALDIIRTALMTHIHGYSGVPADKLAVSQLETIDFTRMLQKNIVIN